MRKKTTTPKAGRLAAAAAPGRCPALAVPATAGATLAGTVPAVFFGDSSTAPAVRNS
ncbi:hypothetical protein [Streptomyces salinarius]|uniref:Uncharacterized protein n=1 Tax=Streptomyces salinarius TaxID=2762598 RepID=A0ABW8BCS2_9ACTN